MIIWDSVNVYYFLVLLNGTWLTLKNNPTPVFWMCKSIWLTFVVISLLHFQLKNLEIYGTHIQTIICLDLFSLLSRHGSKCSYSFYLGLFFAQPPLHPSPRMFLLNFQKSLDLLDTFLCGCCIGPHSGWFCYSMGIFFLGGGGGKFFVFLGFRKTVPLW